MPFRPPFPFFNNNYKYHNYNNFSPNGQFSNRSMNSKRLEHMESTKFQKKEEPVSSSTDSFFEILGLKLYFDDIIIICILYFLYTEKVQDTELFVCLIMLLLS